MTDWPPGTGAFITSRQLAAQLGYPSPAALRADKPRLLREGMPDFLPGRYRYLRAAVDAWLITMPTTTALQSRQTKPDSRAQTPDMSGIVSFRLERIARQT